MIESMSDQIFSELGQSHSNFRHQNFIIVGSALGRSGTTAIFRLFQSSQLFNNFAEDHNVFEIARALYSSIATAQNYNMALCFVFRSLGFERMVLLCTGLSNIRDVIPYPRYPKHADY